MLYMFIFGFPLVILLLVAQELKGRNDVRKQREYVNKLIEEKRAQKAAALVPAPSPLPNAAQTQTAAVYHDTARKVVIGTFVSGKMRRLWETSSGRYVADVYGKLAEGDDVSTGTEWENLTFATRDEAFQSLHNLSGNP